MALEKTNNFLKYTGSLIIEYLKIQNNFQKKYGENTIVLIQIGGFHECYCTNDKGYPLHKLSNLLNIVVSRKDKQKTIIDIKNPYMMGWPISATPKFLKLLIDNNFWVIKIDQVTKSPNPKRKITGIFSPGTYIDNISNSDANIILSLYIEEIIQFNSKPSLYIGLSTIELSVGNVMIHEITSKSNDDKYSLDECIKFIKNLNPKEIIINTKNINSMSDKELINYLELENNNYFLNNMENNSYNKLNYQNEILSLVYNNSYLNHIDDLNLERLINGRISFIILLDYCYEQNHNIINERLRPIIDINGKDAESRKIKTGEMVKINYPILRKTKGDEFDNNIVSSWSVLYTRVILPREAMSRLSIACSVNLTMKNLFFRHPEIRPLNFIILVRSILMLYWFIESAAVRNNFSSKLLETRSINTIYKNILKLLTSNLVRNFARLGLQLFCFIKLPFAVRLKSKIDLKISKYAKSRNDKSKHSWEMGDL